jgi:hypothetical protein
MNVSSNMFVVGLIHGLLSNTGFNSIKGHAACGGMLNAYALKKKEGFRPPD